MFSICRWAIAAAFLSATCAAADPMYELPSGQKIAVLERFQDCDVCPEMVALPMGVFLFGSTQEEADAAWVRFFESRKVTIDDALRKYAHSNRDETPEHAVAMDIPLAMGRNEVTRAEWQACVADGVCTDKYDARINARMPKGKYQRHPRGPVVGVSYLDMQDYVGWLNAKLGVQAYRLPTEVEWEYAARAGSTARFGQGEVLTRAQANFTISWREDRPGQDPRYVWHYHPDNAGRPVVVDELDAANAWGLRHMAGNVLEVTRACYSARHMGFKTARRYLASTYTPLGCKRVKKGGFYAVSPELARPERRVGGSEDHWSPWVGFRVLREMRLASH